MLKKYKISNLLKYQIDDIKNLINGDNVVQWAPQEKLQHLYDAFVGLNDAEVETLTKQGYVLAHYTEIGVGLAEIWLKLTRFPLRQWLMDLRLSI